MPNTEGGDNAGGDKMISGTFTYPNGSPCLIFSIAPRGILLASFLVAVGLQFTFLLFSTSFEVGCDVDWQSFHVPLENRVGHRRASLETPQNSWQEPLTASKVLPHDSFPKPFVVRTHTETSATPLLSDPSIPEFHNHMGPEDADGFSACLLIMDDNHYLVEWLAYHYNFLPLRRAIVAVDPASQTSPKEILDRYRHFIDITLWGDDDVFKEVDTPNDPTYRHRRRQKLFLSKCLTRLKDENRTWVAAVDTDEFVTVHSGAREAFSVKKYLPTLYQMLQDPDNTTPLISATSPCISLRRDQMSYRASVSRWDDSERRPWAWTDFNTLRQRFRSRRTYPSERARPRHLASKSIINVQQATRVSFRSRQLGPHRPSFLCQSANIIVDPRNATYIVHHYPGTLEQFSFREASDPRNSSRSESRYWEYNLTTKSVETNDLPWTWVDNFVDKVGLPLAKKLLKGIGTVEKVGHNP